MNAPTPTRKPKNQPEQDLLDAQFLASYLARNGVQGVEGEIAKVTEIPFPAEDGVLQLPPNFYESYQKLAAKAAPVTVASLRDSLSRFRLIPVRAVNLLASIVTLMVVLCLFVLGHLHSDWLALNDLSSRLGKLPQPLVASTRSAIEKGILTLEKQLDEISEGKRAENFEEILTKLKKLQLELEEDKLVEPQRNHLVKALVTAAETAEEDLVPWRSLSFFAPAIAKEKAQSAEDGVKSVGIPLKSLRMMANLQKVALPMLYGFLGAMVFVLRRIAKDSAQRVFRRESVIEHLVRPFLGAVGGFIIGWFMSPEKTGVIADATIAPFALAFVAGYSLDVLFTLLDRLTATEKPK